MQDNKSPDLPELIIGLVAAIGTPIELVVNLVTSVLHSKGYNTERLHLSQYTDRFTLDGPMINNADREIQRLDIAMHRGSKVRETTGRDDVLALVAIADIIDRRGNKKENKAYVLRQLKHPKEVNLLRRTYGDRFLLIGFYMPAFERESFLIQSGAKEDEARKLMARDDHEGIESGQRFRDVFHLSDVFVRIGENSECEKELDRFISLILGTDIITPRMEEFGMFQAYGAALRSSQMARQVGAAILSDLGDVIAVGTNEVPRAGGGSYWEGGKLDFRDHKKGYDSNDKEKNDIFCEIIQKLEERNIVREGVNISEVHQILEKSRAGSVIEFGRAVHAEADAMASAARMGISLRNTKLFCTTFPCHLCAKQIISSGIDSVTFIEPYPKSLAEKMYGDEIMIENQSAKHDIGGRVIFQPFVGVAPRRYSQLFSMIDFTGEIIKRKESNGIVGNNLFHPRLQYPGYGTPIRENRAIDQLMSLLQKD